MQFNPKDYKEAEESMLPKAGAEVSVIVLDDTEERTSTNGNPMLVVSCKIIAGDGKGLKLRDYIVLNNDWSAMRLGRLLNALGFDITQKYDVTPELIIGKRGKIRIKHEQYEGETKAKVGYWIPSKAGQGGKVEDEDIDESTAGDAAEPEQKDKKGGKESEDGLPF